VTPGGAAVKHGRLATAKRREACLRATPPGVSVQKAGLTQPRFQTGRSTPNIKARDGVSGTEKDSCFVVLGLLRGKILLSCLLADCEYMLGCLPRRRSTVRAAA
jgi:hypothetical protein